MRNVRLGAVSLNQIPLDWEHNKRTILDALRAARAEHVSLVCCPELCLTGYGCEDAFFSSGTHRHALELAFEIAAETKGLAACFGLPLLFQGAIFNTVCVAADGKVLGFVAKHHLAGDGIHYEPRWFKPWPLGMRASLEYDGSMYPLGDYLFQFQDVLVGFEICEDAWSARRFGAELAASGVDIILNPSASHFAFGKAETRERIVLEGSRAFGAAYVYANLLGNEAGRILYDGASIIAVEGEIAAAAPRFSFRDFTLSAATVDIERARSRRAQSASYSPLIEEKGSSHVRCALPLDGAAPVLNDLRQSAWEKGSRVKEEEFLRAVALGLFDYLRKSRSEGFVVSLSGGADSSAVACLAAAGIHLASRELGIEGLRAKLSYSSRLGEISCAQQMVRALLTGVYQATENSSNTTLNAARAVADALGAEFLHFEISGIVKSYCGMVSREALGGRALDWSTHDLSLQNIQARTRGPGVWFVANLKNALLLATSNRSEAAVGYTTMDGDTCGGLSPIAGIDKAFLREWLKWLEVEGSEAFGPIAALQAVTVQAPTAELRPKEAVQTDEADLMPYDVLDAIERFAIRDKKIPLEALQLLRVEFGARYDLATLTGWVERFFKLWCRNQWKRERYAPSFHLDDENLDPKTWCRFPILSGGYERELREMKQWAEEEAKPARR